MRAPINLSRRIPVEVAVAARIKAAQTVTATTHYHHPHLGDMIAVEYADHHVVHVCATCGGNCGQCGITGRINELNNGRTPTASMDALIKSCIPR